MPGDRFRLWISFMTGTPTPFPHPGRFKQICGKSMVGHKGDLGTVLWHKGQFPWVKFDCGCKGPVRITNLSRIEAGVDR